MRFKRNEEINYEYVADFLKAAVEQVKTQEDIDVLKAFKKVFKKNVAWNLRGYVAAYLLKVSTGNARRPFVGKKDFSRDRDREGGREGGRDFSKNLGRDFSREGRGGFSKERDFSRDRESGRDFFRDRDRDRDGGKENFYSAEKREYSHKENEERPQHPRVEIDPSKAATIFIGIGKNRRVFPRDLLGILINAAHLERSRIGDIRVLASYSFVQLYAEDAEKAISILNGYEYRGRPLSVSYSRQRENGEGEENFSSRSEEDLASQNHSHFQDENFSRKNEEDSSEKNSASENDSVQNASENNSPLV